MDSYGASSGTISSAFLSQASNIIGDTNTGLAGSVIADICTAFAVDCDADIPYGTYPFHPEPGNKRTALRKNIEKFSPEQQYTLLMRLCDHPHLGDNQEIRKLKAQIYTRYRHLASNDDSHEINLELVEETRHWLSRFEAAYKVFEDGISKYKSDVLQRNLLDDFRLSLELLCMQLLRNDKSLENQAGPLGEFIKDHGGSKEVQNMFHKVLDYYTKYQNQYVKHSDSVADVEITFVVELTCAMMKYLLQIEDNHD